MLILLTFRNKLVISSPSIIFRSILICMRCLDKFFNFHSRWFFKKDIPHAWLNSFLGVHARTLLKFGIKELERIEIRGGLGHSSPALHTVIQSIQYNAYKVVEFSVTYLLIKILILFHKGIWGSKVADQNFLILLLIDDSMAHNRHSLTFNDYLTFTSTF